MKHTLIVIGFLGVRTAYLDISKEEAKIRYIKDNNGDEDLGCFDEFEFEDEFGVYDAWSTKSL